MSSLFDMQNNVLLVGSRQWRQQLTLAHRAVLRASVVGVGLGLPVPAGILHRASRSNDYTNNCKCLYRCKMTQFLPPNLLALFAPRDPIPFLPQLEKLPHEKHHNQPYSGIAPFIRHFEVIIWSIVMLILLYIWYISLITAYPVLLLFLLWSGPERCTSTDEGGDPWGAPREKGKIRNEIFPS